MVFKKQLALRISTLVLTLCISSAAHAIPTLQLFIDGASYDALTESWVIEAGTFDLWVIGETSTHGSIFDIKLAASMYGTAGTIGITALGGATLDDVYGSDETQFQSGGAFETPAFTSVHSHGEYSAANEHYFWGLGDFTSMNDPIGDYQSGIPTDFPSSGQINKYSITITGYTRVHFDAFDHSVMSTGFGEKWGYQKAPYSHDATAVPEPGTIALLGMGFLGLVQRMRSRRRS